MAVGKNVKCGNYGALKFFSQETAFLGQERGKFEKNQAEKTT